MNTFTIFIIFNITINVISYLTFILLTIIGVSDCIHILIKYHESLNNDNHKLEAINEVAQEHLEINLSNYKKYLNQIHNAGSIMIGKYSPMAVSDYNVGSNHVLPTLGSAKFSSGLNLSEFYKKISHITLTKKGIEKLGESATHLAEYENLKAHALSIKSRIRRKLIWLNKMF